MTGYVVDAGVAVKWLVSEALSERAALLLERDQPLVAPELLYAEAANALWAMAGRRDISVADVREALDLLADAPLTVPCSMRTTSSRATPICLARPSSSRASPDRARSRDWS